MAFGARELRLVLSIQSYGTGNLQRLRRDMTALERTANMANRNQLNVQRQIEQNAAKSARVAERIRKMETRALAAQGVGPSKRRLALENQFVDLGHKRHLMSKYLSGELRTIDKVGNQILRTLRSQGAVEQEITRALGNQRALYAQLSAEAKRLVTVEQFRAAQLDRQAATMQLMAQREVKARTVAHVGRTMQFGGLIGVAALGTAANSFAKFNKQVTLAATQARGLDRPLSDIPILAEGIANGVDKGAVHIEGIMDLMRQFPATGDEMAQAAYDIFSSMDISFGGGMKLLKTFNQLAVATGSDLTTAVDAGITVMNNFGASSGTVNERLNLMITTIRFGRMRLEDFNAMLEKVAPAATASGQRLQDVVGAMVAITRLQPSQRVGATGIARLLQTFRDPDFQKGVFIASKGVTDITKGKGPTGDLKALPDIIRDMSKEFGLFAAQGGPGELFKTLTALGHGSGQGRASRIEAINAYTFLVGHVQEYLDLQTKATTDTGEFAVALKAMSKSPGVRWEIFLNQVRAFALTVGEAAIPALLTLADKLTAVFHWFGNLNQATRGLIGSMGVWISVGLLVVGTLTNMAGGLVAAIYQWRIYSAVTKLAAAESEIAAGKMGMVTSALRVMAGIGIIAIPIVVQLIKGGEPGLWSFLSAAGFGAIGGAMIGGIPGAIGGALAAPLAVQITADLQFDKDPAKAAWQKAFDQKGWRKAIRSAIPFTVKPQAMPFEQWLKQNPKQLEAHKKYLAEHGKGEGSIWEKYLRESNVNTKKWLANQAAANKKYLEMLNGGNSKLSEAQKREIAMRKAHVNAVQAAQDHQTQIVKQGVDNLSQIYDQLHAQNEAAFGGIGQGPVMGGVMGSVFTGLNDMLRQFGVQIPIPFAIIKQDLDQQLEYFTRFREDLNKLQKAGAPPLLLQQITEMGPEQGIAFAEGILDGGKSGFKGYFKEYRRIQKLIDNATQQDLHRKLKYWNTYGKDAAFAMLTGLSSSLQTAGLRGKFANMIHNSFGVQLRAQFKKDVDAAMKKAVEDYNAGLAAAKAAAGGTTTTGGGDGKGGGGKGGKGGGTAPLSPTERAAQAFARTRSSIASRRRVLATLGQTFTSAGSEKGTMISSGEQRMLEIQQDAIVRLQRQAARQKQALNVARISPQFSKGENFGKKEMNINYHGDTYHVSATLTPQQFLKLVKRQAWRKRHKVPRS